MRMPNRFLSILAAIVLAMGMAGCGPTPTPEPTRVPTPAPTATMLPTPTVKPEFPSSVYDDWGRKVDIAKKPERIISLAPSNTEILFALGLGDKVVGVTDACDYPAQAKGKEKVVSLGKLSQEKIVALKPDLILAAGITSKDDVKRLEELKLTVLVLDPKDLDVIIRDIILAGAATGTAKEATRIADGMNQKFESLRARIKTVSTKPKVFYELDATNPAKPYTVGPGNFIDYMLQMAGATNAAAGAKAMWAEFSTEELLKQDPDLIILGDSNYGITPASVKARPGWDKVKAVKNGAVYPIDDTLVSRPGPRIIDGFEALVKIVHPELFR